MIALGHHQDRPVNPGSESPGLRKVWIASFPRSGNTFLRIVLKTCFDLDTGSIYRNDLGGNVELEAATGHREGGDESIGAGGRQGLILTKTHELDQDELPAFYVLRDGRDAVVSLWRFLDKAIPLYDVILGRHAFGTWSDHVRSWAPETRPETLFIRYEDLVQNFDHVLPRIGAFLNRDIRTSRVPSRAELAAIGGRWINQRPSRREDMSPDLLELFQKVNGDALQRYGYL